MLIIAKQKGSLIDINKLEKAIKFVWGNGSKAGYCIKDESVIKFSAAYCTSKLLLSAFISDYEGIEDIHNCEFIIHISNGDHITLNQSQPNLIRKQDRGKIMYKTDNINNYLAADFSETFDYDKLNNLLDILNLDNRMVNVLKLINDLRITNPTVPELYNFILNDFDETKFAIINPLQDLILIGSYIEDNGLLFSNDSYKIMTFKAKEQPSTQLVLYDKAKEDFDNLEDYHERIYGPRYDY